MLVFNLAAGQILKIDHITWSDTIRFIWLLFLFVCSDWEFYSMDWIPFIFHLNPLYCRSTMCCSNLLFLLIVFVFSFFGPMFMFWKYTATARHRNWRNLIATVNECKGNKPIRTLQRLHFLQRFKYFYTQTTGPGQTRMDFVMEILMTPHIRMTFKYIGL